MHAAGPQDTDRQSRRHWRWLALLPLLVYAGYLAGANWLLNTTWAQKELAERTGMSIRWDSGHSWVPGRLEVTTLRVHGEAPGLPLRLEMEEVKLRLSLAALIGGHLEITAFSARGVRTIAFGIHRLAGHGRMELEGLRLENREVSIERLSLDLNRASIHADSTVLADDIRLGASLRVEPFRLRDASDLDAARFVSGDLSLDATADAWDVFAPYLGQLDWLALAGHGQLSGRLRLERGVLAPGSELTLDSPSLQVDIDERVLFSSATDLENRQTALASEAPETDRLSGAGRINTRVEAGDQGPTATLEVNLEDMVMHRAGLVDPFLTSRRFRLSARLPGADLADTPGRLASARLEWEDARLPDAGALSAYLPEGSPFSLQSGSVDLEGVLEYRDGVIEGGFRLAGNQVALTLAGQPLRGEMTLDLVLAELDPGQRRLDLTGTRLEVSARGEGDAKPLTTEVTLEDARLVSRVPLDALPYLQGPPPLDGRVVLQGRVGRLDVLDDLLAQAVGGRGWRLAGGGDLAASLRLEQGRVASGSQLAVETDSLQVSVLDLDIWGQGSLVATWALFPEGARVHLETNLENSRVARQSDSALLMQGGRFDLVAESDLVGLGAPLTPPRLSLSWEDAEMPDIAVLQAYVPGTLPIELLSGRAATRGDIRVEDGIARGRLTLTGQRINGRVLDETLVGELALDLNLREAYLDGRRVDFSGSRFEMQAAEANADADQRLQTLVRVRQGWLGPLPVPGNREPDTGLAGELALEGLIANIGGLDAFLPVAQGLALSGGGHFEADLRVREDRLQPGSVLRLEADDLVVGFLDYQAMGSGTLDAEIEGQPGDPEARLTLGLPGFELRRLGNDEAHISGRHFHLETHTTRFGLDPEARSLQNFTTRIRLPIAEVADMSRYNAYLPEGASLALLGGKASLEANLTLEGQQARGELILQAFDTRLRLGDQRLSGDLRLEARLREGDLVRRRFNAAGSRLRLDNVTREDADGNRDTGWWARLHLEEGELTWTRPLGLRSRLGLEMRDSGLLARLFLADARERGWLGRRLSVPDVRGTARLLMDADSIRLRDARLQGGNLTLLADLIMRDEVLTGGLYARLGALGVGVDLLANGGTDLRLLQPRRWFERNRDDLDMPLEAVPPDEWRQALEVQREATP